MDSFFLIAALGGIGVALVAGPLGSFIVWRRMAYFGDTLSHSGLLGIALGLMLNIYPTFGLILTTIIIAGLLYILERQKLLPTDTLLGILSHTALSVGLITIGFMQGVRIDLNALLFGDLLSLEWTDVIQIYVVSTVIISVIYFLWDRLLMVTISSEVAAAEGIPSNTIHLIFLLIMALTIAISMKVVGILLITSLLIIPAATARRLSRSPESMAILASFNGSLSVLGGLTASWLFDIASGPAIVVAAALLFVISLLIKGKHS